MSKQPLNKTDFYKVGHRPMYPPGTQLICTNGTFRKSRLNGIDEVVFFGLQYYIKKYLLEDWRLNFFEKPLDEVVNKYKRRIENSLGKDCIKFDHIEALHNLGYLPICIMAVPEGTPVPIKVAPFVIWNTNSDFFWLTNYLETIISCTIWQPCTSATLAKEFRKLFNKAAIDTNGSTVGTNFQGHDFSFRGMSSLETAETSGAGHLLFFDGTDTIPAIDFLEEYYGADTDKMPFGFSVPATEHSVMCMGSKDGEILTFERLLDLFPTGYLSVVSDTWNLWDVTNVILPKLKEKIMLREGKLVIRPDSGDPVDIICGMEAWEKYPPMDFSDVIVDSYPQSNSYIVVTDKGEKKLHPKHKGVIELLWDVFGGTVNEQGFKVLDSHIGAIYGDSISIDRANQINKRLKDKGFASINWVAGIGSFTYQYNTRDTFGFAMKATYGEVEVLESLAIGEFDTTSIEELMKNPKSHHPIYKIESREIWKDPITDDGTKKSAKGLIAVYKDENGKLIMKDQATWHDVTHCEFQQVFRDGKAFNEQNFYDIRKIANRDI